MSLDSLFYMHRRDRRILVALLLVALVALLMLWLGRGGMTGDVAVVADSVAVDSGTQVRRAHAPVYYKVDVPPVEHFAFDPNEADSTTLLRLGLTPYMVRAVYRYRAKGGIYRSKEDFAHLPGLTLRQYRELAPYIRIASDLRPAAEVVKAPAVERDTLRYPRKLAEGEQIDLTQADTTLLRRVPGIGSYYARRIVSYGRRLGGYARVEQLLEIDGFPAQSLSYFMISAPQLQKLNFNRLSQEELRTHPYLNYYQARAIVDQRRLHGPLRSIQDMRLHPDFTPEDIQRLEPYAEF